jgi:hypothetical protein
MFLFFLGDKMKTICTFVSLVVLSPSLVFAGEIYGNIKEGQKPIKEGIKVEIVNPNDPCDVLASTETGKRGSYSLYLDREGRFKLRVFYGDPRQLPEIDVYLYKEPVRYNLVLERKPNGEYSLRRD